MSSRNSAVELYRSGYYKKRDLVSTNQQLNGYRSLIDAIINKINDDPLLQSRYCNLVGQLHASISHGLRATAYATTLYSDLVMIRAKILAYVGTSGTVVLAPGSLPTLTLLIVKTMADLGKVTFSVFLMLQSFLTALVENDEIFTTFRKEGLDLPFLIHSIIVLQLLEYYTTGGSLITKLANQNRKIYLNLLEEKFEISKT